MVTVQDVEKQLRDIESSLKRVLTQIENSNIDTEIKCGFVADIEEILTEVHHLVPVQKKTDIPVTDIIELCSLADKLDATGSGVYATLFDERLQEIARVTGQTIPEVKNAARAYRANR